MSRTLLLSLLVAAAACAAPVRLTNHQDGSTVRYSVPLLCGELDRSLTSVTVVKNTSSSRETRTMAGLAHDGRFKALAELVPGPNKLRIEAGKNSLAVTLHFKPQTNPIIARAVYFVANDGNTDFDTPLEDDAQNWRGKLDTAMKLMQTFTAERFHDIGLPRATFHLELDDAGKVQVHLLKGPKSMAEYHKLDGGQLYGHIAGLIRRQLPHPTAHDLVVMGVTRFNRETGKAMAHTALGGGRLALFGGGNLFTWPDSLPAAQAGFMNARPIDPKQFFSDSVGRHTFWAAASTCIGASLHELGHTYGLPHSRDAQDIMTRGHDRFNRVFTLVEPPHARRGKPYLFKANEIGYWAPVSAYALQAHRAFALDAREWSETNRIAIRLDVPEPRVLIEAPGGIRYVGLYTYGEHGVSARRHVPVEGAPIELALPLADVRKGFEKENISIKVMDGQGHTRVARLSDLLKGPYVQAWRFASISHPWPYQKPLPALDAKAIAAIEADAAKAKLVRSAESFVDFNALAPVGGKSQATAYAMRTLKTDKPRTIRIHTGSDDSLRLWLNGKLVKAVPAYRAAVADSEVTDVQLIPGENRLLVEVGQGSGGWGLILRLQDADGARLHLADDGTLTRLE